MRLSRIIRDAKIIRKEVNDEKRELLKTSIHDLLEFIERMPQINECPQEFQPTLITNVLLNILGNFSHNFLPKENRKEFIVTIAKQMNDMYKQMDELNKDKK